MNKKGFSTSEFIVASLLFTAIVIFTVIGITGFQTNYPDYDVIEELVRRAPTHPKRAIGAMEKILWAHPDRWITLTHKENIRTIIQAALRSRDEVAVNDARTLVSRLYAAGLQEFTDLLEKK